MAGQVQGVSAFLVRWRRWLIPLALLVVVRAALPEILRRVLVAQISQRLQTRVEVGDVDLALYRGGVALADVALYSPVPAAPDEPPLVAWKRFAIELRYLPLLWKTVRLRRVLLEGPSIALDRLANGELNLRRLVPAPAASDTAPAPPAEEARGSAWKIGIDRFALHAGGVRFRDLTLPEGEPLEIAIPDVSVNDVALQPGLYGAPAHVDLYVRSEGGRLRVESRVWALAQGFALATRLKAYRLPLRRARFYIPGVGWSELRGELDAVVDHGLAPGTRNELSATLRLRDVAIQVPDLGQAALAVERFAVRIAPLDLLAHRVRVRDVAIGGAAVVADLAGGEVLPLLAHAARAAPPAEPAPEPPPAAGTAPWHWTLDRLRLTDSKVSLLQEQAPLDVGVTATVRHLADEGDPGRAEVTLAVAPGSVAVAGAVRAMPPGFGGTVRIEALPVDALVRAARAAARLPPGLLQAAALQADLAIEAGLTGEGSPSSRPDALLAKGAVGLDGVRVEGPDPGLFSVAWKRLAVPIDGLEVPGVVPGAPPTAAASIHVALGAVRLEEPSVKLTRTAEGLALPPPFGAPAGADRAAPPPAAATPAAATPPAATAPAPEVSLLSFVLSHGRIAFADRTVKPFFSGEVAPLDVQASGIRSVGPVVDRFSLSAKTPQKGSIEISGSLRPDGGTIRVNGKEVALTPYNPYVTAYSSYSLGRGSSLSVRTDVTFGKGRYDTTTALALHRLNVKGAAGDTLFKQQFGIPLSLALALLRDPGGNIGLDIPVAADESGMKIGMGTIVAGALRDAILGAVTSPLKAFGAVLGSGDRAGAIEPPPIAAEVGRPTLTAEGKKQVAQLAEFLAGRPGMTVELDPVVTPADARWLQEQDLRAELEARTGVLNSLRDLPQRNTRRRIVQALAERATGKPGELEGDDAAQLDAWLAERPAVPPARLQTLARERAAAAAAALRDQHGVAGERLTVGDAGGEPREGTPAVLIGFGAAGD